MFGDFELHCRLGPFVGFMSSLCDNYFFFLGLVKWSTVEEMGWYSRYLVEDIGQSIYSGNVILSVVFVFGFSDVALLVVYCVTLPYCIYLEFGF